MKKELKELLIKTTGDVVSRKDTLTDIDDVIRMLLDEVEVGRNSITIKCNRDDIPNLIEYKMFKYEIYESLYEALNIGEDFQIDYVKEEKFKTDDQTLEIKLDNIEEKFSTEIKQPNFMKYVTITDRGGLISNGYVSAECILNTVLLNKEYAVYSDGSDISMTFDINYSLNNDASLLDIYNIIKFIKSEWKSIDRVYKELDSEYWGGVKVEIYNTDSKDNISMSVAFWINGED